MPRRSLLSGEEPGTEIGSVSFYDGELVLDGAAENVLGTVADMMGREEFGAALIEHGWSNGYLWLGPVTDGDPAVDDGSVPVEVISDGG